MPRKKIERKININGDTEDLGNTLSDEDLSKLDGIESNAQKNVQSDWNATSGDSMIKNKPTIPDTSGFAKTSDLENYLPLTGNSSENPISGTMQFGNSGALIRSGNSIYRFGSGTTDAYVAVLARNGSSNFFRAGNDNVMDLGATNTRWKNLYLSGNLSDGTNSITIGNIANKNDVPTIVSLTQAEYDALGTYDENTYYFIKEE